MTKIKQFFLSFTLIAGFNVAQCASSETTLESEVIAAVKSGDVGRTRELLTEHPELKNTTNDDNLFHLAILNETLILVPLLAQHGVDIHAPAQADNQTPIMLALRLGQSNGARLLFENGASADINAFNALLAYGTVVGYDDEHDLENFYTMVRMLLSYGFNPTGEAKEEQVFLDALKDSNGSWDSTKVAEIITEKSYHMIFHWRKNFPKELETIIHAIKLHREEPIRQELTPLWQEHRVPTDLQKCLLVNMLGFEKL